jgi:hypothetical protein
MRYVFDETLSDLETITATVNRTVAEATAKEPSIVTLTIESGLLQQILTAASLHMHENPFVPKPEVGDMAEVIAQNNEEGQDWHYLMRDAIEIVSARASKAAHPKNSGGEEKERRVRDDRKHRKLMAQWKKDEKVKAEATDPNTPEGIKARWDAMGIKPLDSRKIVGLMITLMEQDAPVAHDVAVQMFEAYRQEASKVVKLEERVSTARRALGGY